MNVRRSNLVGKRFGRLVVVELEGTVTSPCGTKRLAWRCRCDCGSTRVVRGADLVNGATKSCGCWNSESNRARHFKHGRAGRADGSERTREYQAWANAKTRCTNPKFNGYENYGGRGIRMCDEWLNSFEAFYRDMGPCPPGLELDRKDVNGNYEPGNCRWATNREQMNNVRKNRFVEFEGERLTVAEASRRVGISPFVVYGRLNNGWSAERALREPVAGRK